MKVAIVHDWLTQTGGAELVLQQLIELYPDCEVFSLLDFLEQKDRDFYLAGKTVKTSFIQKLPFAKKLYRNYLPLMPIAIEQFDFSGFDVVISSSYAVAKGVITSPNQLHISYCHSPIRYAWDMQTQYLKESNMTSGLKSVLVRYLLHKIRIWDHRSAASVDQFIANSNFIKKRINKFYKRDSEVIFPPVDVSSFALQETKEDFYVTASRMVPYKKICLIVQAFSKMPDKKLVVIGTGPDFDKIKSYASDNVELMGYQPYSVLIEKMQKARAFVFAAEEDFGIVPLEAQACGTPVIAYGIGGSLDTVVDGETGVYFHKQDEQSLIQAVEKFETLSFDPLVIRKHAEGFSSEIFRQNVGKFVEDEYKKYHGIVEPATIDEPNSVTGIERVETEKYEVPTEKDSLKVS
ncbi:glycosyltransferase family 4 protein [Vibrio sp. WJH972]